jgi:hypothetical protein
VDTIRQQIRDAALAEFNDGLPTGLSALTKRRFIPGHKIEAPRAALIFGAEETSRPNSSSALTRREFNLWLQIVVPCEEAEESDDLIEPYLARATAKFGSTSFSGLATDVAELGTQWVPDSSSGVFLLSCVQRWRIQYQTRRDDLSLDQ